MIKIKMAEARHVTPENYAPDIKSLVKNGYHLLRQLGVRTADSIQAWTNDSYKEGFPKTALQAEEQGILRHVSRTIPALEVRVKALIKAIKMSKPLGASI